MPRLPQHSPRLAPFSQLATEFQSYKKKNPEKQDLALNFQIRPAYDQGKTSRREFARTRMEKEVGQVVYGLQGYATI
jgi:hypothetical protein